MRTLFTILCLCCLAADWKSEVEQSAIIAAERGFQAEAVMPDGSRCDLVGEHAIEVEWAEKWKEAPGQAVLYSIWTGLPPKVLLLSKGDVDKLHILRCRLVCERLHVAMEVVPAIEK